MADHTPVPAESVEVKVEAKEEEKMETVTAPVEEPKEMVTVLRFLVRTEIVTSI